ncbi:hypothetical protein [Lentzea sp. E54]|uniref:hypothetical protein n=1 Tax=Lentzea xerophila TaxID=3435883 RepID=UPI003DA2BBAC
MSEDGQLHLEGLGIEEGKPVVPEGAAEPDLADNASAAEPEAEASGEVVADAELELVDDDAVGAATEIPIKPAAVEAADDVAAGASARTAEEPVETETAQAVTSAAVDAPTALYFLTNRMNLNGVLSSRLVAPRESFGKYYADLLDRCPGWVPLLTQPPDQDLIDAVLAERGAGAPVIIEFPLSVAGKQPLDVPAVYVPAVALAEAIAIHFREERDLREHAARGYSNVHPHDDLLKVTPALFAGASSAGTTIVAPSEAASIDWQRIDRIRGAVNAAVAAAGSGEQLAVAAAFLGAVKFPATVTLPGWISWLELDDHSAPDDRIGPDHVGFRAMYDALGKRDAAEAWSPNAILDEVDAGIQTYGLPADLLETVDRNLKRVRSIVNVEVDFEPFRSNARALVSAKSLLLVLMRPDLGELLAWPQQETGADDITRVTAAVLAGRLRGLSREAIHLRTVALDDLTAAWAVRVAHGKAVALSGVQFTANTRGTALKVDGVELEAREPLMQDAVAKYRKIAEAKREAARIKVCRAMGWPVEHRIEVPEGAAVTSDQTGIIVSTPSEVSIVASVVEEPFVQQLAALSGDARRRALSALDVRRR